MLSMSQALEIIQTRRNVIIPSDKWMDAALEYTRYTPDIMDICLTAKHVTFLYDESMRGRSWHKHIQDESKFQMFGFTKDRVQMWKKELGVHSFPIPLESLDPRDITPWETQDRFMNKFRHQAYLKGELHLLDPMAILRLDNHMENGVAFERKRVKIEVPELLVRKDINRCARRIVTTEAWMYVGIRSFWDQQLDAGFAFSPCEIFNGRPELPPYYFYTRMNNEK